MKKTPTIISILFIIALGGISFFTPPHYHHPNANGTFKEWNSYFNLYTKNNRKEPTSFDELVNFLAKKYEVNGNFYNWIDDYESVQALQDNSIKINYKTPWPWTQGKSWCILKIDNRKNKNLKQPIGVFCSYPKDSLGIGIYKEELGLNQKEVHTLLLNN